MKENNLLVLIRAFSFALYSKLSNSELPYLLLLLVVEHNNIPLFHKNYSHLYKEIYFLIVLFMFQKLTPSRYHKIYLVNLMPIARPLLQIGKKLLSQKIADRVM